MLHGDGVVQAAVRLIEAGHSVDLGLMQINSRNLDLLGLPLRDAFTACKSVEAAAKLLSLFSRYNTGSPTRGIANGYAIRVMETLDGTRTKRLPDAATGNSDPPKQQPTCDRSADVWDRDPCQPHDQDFVQHYGDQPQ